MTTSSLQTGATERLFTADFVRLAVADLAYFTAAGVAIFALPSYVTGPVGSDKAGAGLAFGAFAVTALALRPYAGRLSDTRGRMPLMVGGAFLAAAMMLLTAFVHSLPLVIALRLGLGVAEAAFFVASFAALADLAPPSRMGEALSYNSLGLYLGLTLGPPLGEALLTVGYTAAWAGAAGLLVAAGLISCSLGETRPTSLGTTPPDRLIHWQAVPVALGFLASIVAMGGFLAFASLYADEVGLARTSLPIAVYGVTVVVGRIAFAKVPDRVPSLPLGAASLAAMASGLVVAAAWPEPACLLVGAALLGLGITFSTPAFFTAIFATASPSQRGAAAGTGSIAIDLGLGGGPILLGYVAQGAGIPWAFAVAAGVALAGGLSSLMLHVRRSRPSNA